MVKQFSPELPWGEMKFDFPPGKFHSNVSKGFRWKELGGEKMYFLQMLTNVQVGLIAVTPAQVFS